MGWWPFACRSTQGVRKNPSRTTQVHNSSATYSSKNTRSKDHWGRLQRLNRRLEDGKYLLLVVEALQPPPQCGLAYAPLSSNDHLHVVLSSRAVELAPAKGSTPEHK